MSGAELNWIFDCWSRATARFRPVLEAWIVANGRPTDFLFLSHFDTDHVSGIDILLDRAAVREGSAPAFGLGALAHAAAEHARSEAGRREIAALYARHKVSSNRASLSLFAPRWSRPGGTAYGRYGAKTISAREWTSAQAGSTPATRSSKVAPIYTIGYELPDVRVLALPHHGSDRNADRSFQNAAHKALLTAHVRSNAREHPGPLNALVAGRRLAKVTADPATRVEMKFEVF